MNREKTIRLLESIGVQITSRNMQTLGTLLASKGVRTGSVTAREMCEETGLSRVWVYKSLKNLHATKIISMLRLINPRQYGATVETVMDGLRLAQKQTLDSLINERERINEEIIAIKNVHMFELATHIINGMVDNKLQQISGTIESIANIQISVANEMPGLFEVTSK